MSVRDQSTEPLDPLFREALRWIALVASPEATESDARMAVAWRAQSAAHDAAFQEAAAFRRFVRATDPPGRTAEVVAFPSRAPPPGLSRRAAMFGGGAMAAGVAGLMAARPPLGLWPSLAEFMADRHTGAGQRRSFAMTGGAAVELNGRTAVSIVDHGHGLKLVEGEAFVAAARGTTPVLVRAGDAALTLASGSLNVRTSARETCATCLSGAAVAEHPGGRVTLAAGATIDVSAGAVVSASGKTKGGAGGDVSLVADDYSKLQSAVYWTADCSLE